LRALLQKLFINRDYGLLFMGRLVSQVGDGILYFALTWLVLDLTGSGTALGTLLLVSSIPGVVLAPLAGVLADMWNRKSIVVITDIVRGLVLLALGAVHAAGHLSLAMLYAATIAFSICGVLFGPAISAAIPGMVKREELTAANARNNFSRSATGIIGPALGALLLALVGYTGVFIITGICFLLSALSEMFIRFPKQELGTSQRGWEQVRAYGVNFRDGFTYVWQNSSLRGMIGYAIALNFIAAPIMSIIMPYFGKEVLQMSAEHYGLVKSAVPAGLLIGTFFVGALTQRISKERLLVGGVIGQGLGGMLIGVAAMPVVYQQLSEVTLLGSLLVPAFLIGVLNVLVNVPLQVMLQETIPDKFRGRVFGLIDGLVTMLVPVALGAFGPAVDRFAPHVLFLICSGGMAAIGVLMDRSPKLAGLYDVKMQESPRL